MTIPENRIIQSKGLGDTIGDIVESFNLDLTSNYGAIRLNGVKQSSVLDGVLNNPVGFALFNNSYYFICDDYLFKGGTNPSQDFEVFQNESTIRESYSDIKVFNENLYVSCSGSIFFSDGLTWTETATALTTSVHLMEVFGNRLYVTEDKTKVWSINTSNTLSTSGVYTLDLGLSPEWNITTLKAIGNYLFIGLLNENTGEGMVCKWNGAAENILVEKINIPAGVIAGTVLDNILYIIDTEGILKKYAGNSFVEVARLFKKKEFYFDGANGFSNRRYIHPNGIQTTQNGTIVFLLSNKLENIADYENTIPSGIYEWDKNIGIYHKYSINTDNDCGQQRISEAGALYVQKPTTPLLAQNGSLIFGATYYTDATSTTSGVFYNDTNDTVEKCGYFTTTFKMSDTQDTWQKIYATYKKLKNSISKIVLKYRTEEHTPTEATITWTDINKFTTTTDLSDYSIGDEVQGIQGNGSGRLAHITSITLDGSTYTVVLDDNFGESNTIPGTTAKVLVDKWIKAGTTTFDEQKQFKEFPISLENTSPIIQLKVFMEFNGKEELYKLKIINNKDVKQ